MAVAEASAARKSDLGIRTASALVMVAIAGTALWLGGLVWSLFAVAIMLGVLWEWRCLVAGITYSPVKRGLSNAAGIAYVGFATWMLVALRVRPDGALNVLQIVSAVIATDVGAYFAGRTFGGPKIAPKISPSKTWAGLIGGMIASGLIFACWALYFRSLMESRLEILGLGPVAGSAAPNVWSAAIGGALLAVIAQAGDFFESWMKRRAGVKDSSHLIPGHGGLFDRLDGLLAVSFVAGILLLLSSGLEGIS
jgi:phosphatidate cytidylyltransferase